MFLSYCLLEVPSNLAMYRFGARKWIARIMITWGLAAAATAFAVGPISFYLIRFLLGVFEAGFFPGVIWYLSIWYPANHRTKALAWFMAATPLSSVVGGPAAVSLLAMDGILGLAGWQWMFLILGLPATFLGILCLSVLADEPRTRLGSPRVSAAPCSRRSGRRSTRNQKRISLELSKTSAW